MVSGRAAIVVTGKHAPSWPRTAAADGYRIIGRHLAISGALVTYQTLPKTDRRPASDGGQI